MYNLAGAFRAAVCMKLGSKQASKLDPQPTLKREARKNKQGIAVYTQHQRKVGKGDSRLPHSLVCRGNATPGMERRFMDIHLQARPYEDERGLL